MPNDNSINLKIQLHIVLNDSLTPIVLDADRKGSVECRIADHVTSWFSPPDWTGPCPVVYKSFDNLEGITLMEGNQNVNFSLIQGKV